MNWKDFTEEQLEQIMYSKDLEIKSLKGIIAIQTSWINILRQDTQGLVERLGQNISQEVQGSVNALKSSLVSFSGSGLSKETRNEI